MLKKCIKCNNNISFKDFYIRGFFNNYYKYTCPKCDCEYKASKQSILIYFFIALLPMIVLTRLNEKWIIFLWLIISIFVLQPLILKFEKI
ncbi:hypothetical protein CF065_13155 [Clostridium sporogenes]